MPNYCEPLITNPPEEWDCYGEYECVCPYCGEEASDSWELGSGREEDGEMECGHCNRLFHWSREISVTYSTTPIIGPHPEKTE